MESSEDEQVPGASELFGEDSDSDDDSAPAPTKKFLESSSDSDEDPEPPSKKRIGQVSRDTFSKKIVR